MESELERFNKQNTQLELNITELRQKLKATDKEMHQERQRVCRLCRTMQFALFLCFQELGCPAKIVAKSGL